MATLNDIDLSSNTRWLNEFEGSAIESQQKWTEDGRQFLFQKPRQKFRKIQYDCGWQIYTTVKQLELLRDSGAVSVLTHNDNRTFYVILDSIESMPIKAANQHAELGKFSVKLNLTEV
jgi:hypothetical protein